jgi:hypothetical protein
MQSHTPNQFPFGPNFNWDKENPLTQHSEELIPPLPPIPGTMVYLTGNTIADDMAFLDGSNMLFLGT